MRKLISLLLGAMLLLGAVAAVAEEAIYYDHIPAEAFINAEENCVFTQVSDTRQVWVKLPADLSAEELVGQGIRFAFATELGEGDGPFEPATVEALPAAFGIVDAKDDTTLTVTPYEGDTMTFTLTPETVVVGSNYHEGTTIAVLYEEGTLEALAIIIYNG